MQRELRWDNQIGVGKVADWIRGTIQNTISNEYLASQTAGLFRPGVTTAHGCEYICTYMCEVGVLIVWEVGATDDISSIIDMSEGTLEKEDECPGAKASETSGSAASETSGNAASETIALKFVRPPSHF
jgi:hypothetical protein